MLKKLTTDQTVKKEYDYVGFGVRHYFERYTNGFVTE